MTTVLVIEDEEEILILISEILSYENCNILSATDGQKGLEMAQVYTPDLILCDVMLPNLTGYDILQVLKTNPQTETIPFIFMTAQARREDIQRGLELGANTYLTKPFSITDFLATVSQYLP